MENEGKEKGNRKEGKERKKQLRGRRFFGTYFTMLSVGRNTNWKESGRKR
jgi:hypothetical protein